MFSLQCLYSTDISAEIGGYRSISSLYPWYQHINVPEVWNLGNLLVTGTLNQLNQISQYLTPGKPLVTATFKRAAGNLARLDPRSYGDQITQYLTPYTTKLHTPHTTKCTLHITHCTLYTLYTLSTYLWYLCSSTELAKVAFRVAAKFSKFVHFSCIPCIAFCGIERMCKTLRTDESR